MSGRSTKPHRAVARQNRGAISSTFRRAGVDPRHRLGQDREDEETFVQRAVVLQVPHHHRGAVALGPSEEHGGTRHARNPAFGNPAQ